MTLTQVSTWFANARRRLKKENNLKDDEDDRTESSLGKLTKEKKLSYYNLFLKTMTMLPFTRVHP